MTYQKVVPSGMNGHARDPFSPSLKLLGHFALGQIVDTDMALKIGSK